MSRDHVFRLCCVWLAVDLRFGWFRAVAGAYCHRFAARTGFGCTCGEYERGLRMERRPDPCPNRRWHAEQARAYLREAASWRRNMRSENGRQWDHAVRLETQAEWMVQGGPPFLALGEPELREAA